MDLFAARHDRSNLAAVRRWAREALALEDADAVAVAELACHEPGCPPHETVLLVAREGHPTVQHKIAKPVAAVSREDVTAAAQTQGEPTA